MSMTSSSKDLQAQEVLHSFVRVSLTRSQGMAANQLNSYRGRIGILHAEVSYYLGWYKAEFSVVRMAILDFVYSFRMKNKIYSRQLKWVAHIFEKNNNRVEKAHPSNWRFPLTKSQCTKSELLKMALSQMCQVSIQCTTVQTLSTCTHLDILWHLHHEWRLERSCWKSDAASSWPAMAIR